MRRLLTAPALALLLLLACGCSYRTAGSPGGGATVSAEFNDVQNLAVGHSVQISNVRVGTVTAIRLVGGGKDYRVRVTMSLRKGIQVPRASTAQLSITSLLGENYVNIQPPAAGLATGPFLPSGGTIATTTVVPAFEQVVGRAGPLLSALSGNDIATIVDAGSTAFGGKGPALSTMIGQTNRLLGLLASQRAQLDQTISSLAAFGHQLASGEDALGKLPGTLATTTKVLADDRQHLLDTIDKITALAKQTNDGILAGNVGKLRTMVTELGPVISTFASDKTNLSGLIETMQEFVAKVPRAVYNGQLLLYPVLVFNTGSSTTASKASPTSAVGVMKNLNAMLGGGR